MFIPRHPVVENQFCSFTVSGTITPAGAGGGLAYAGAVCESRRTRCLPG